MADEIPPQEISCRRGAPLPSCKRHCDPSKGGPTAVIQTGVGAKTGRGADSPAVMLACPKGPAQPLPGALEQHSIRNEQRWRSRTSLEVALRGLFAFGSNGHQIQTQLDGQKRAELPLGPLVVKLHV